MLGGVLSLGSAWLSHRFGAAVGGLFLAFPAIFPASATLVENTNGKRNSAQALSKLIAVSLAAAIDARGAALGSAGLLAFAFVAWRLLPQHSLALALPLAMLVWLVVLIGAWRLS